MTSLLALVAVAGSAAGYQVQYCAQVPIVGGIPPWGFHTGSPITGATGSYARGHGDINLAEQHRSAVQGRDARQRDSVRQLQRSA